MAASTHSPAERTGTCIAMKVDACSFDTRKKSSLEHSDVPTRERRSKEASAKRSPAVAEGRWSGGDGGEAQRT